MNWKVGTIIACAVVIVAAGIFAIFHYRPQAISTSGAVVSTGMNSIASASSTPSITSSTASDCLPSNEYAEIPAGEEKQTFYGPLLTSSTIDVSVKDKTTNNVISTFKIENVDYPSVHSFDFRQCAVYIMRAFGQYFGVAGSDVQLWRYDYMGNGKELFNLFAVNSDNVEEIFYQTDFNVSPTGEYLILEQAPNEASDSIVIYEADNLQSIFTLAVSDILKSYPNITGMVEFYPGGWSSDDRYFWFDFFNDADVYGFVRIDTTNWSYQAFAAPTTTMAGDAFNPDTGMTTYETNVAPWTGDAEIDQEYQQVAAQSGQISTLHIYDFLTHQNYLVATTTDPTYYFQPKWISDTQLQYSLQDGATSTYTVSP